jgi:hypothetical protein
LRRGEPLDDPLRDRLVTLVGRRGRDLGERRVALAPAEQLGGMDLVEALAARHAVVDLDEERYAPDQRRDLLGVGAEAEVAVPVGRARRRKHERALRRGLQQVGLSEKWLGARSHLPAPVGRARDRREEVGDMAEVVAAVAFDRGPAVKRVHRVDAHPVQALVVRLEHVDQADRLSVGIATIRSASGGM